MTDGGEGNHGRSVSEETRKKMSESHKNISEETRQKMRNAKKGKYDGENHPFYGKHHSKESIEKMVVKKSKPVYCVELNIIFKSTVDASEKLGIKQGNISLVCLGKRKTAGGYHFEYINKNIA